MGLSRRRHSGFTLVELLITVAVLAVVSAVAIPRFGDMVARNRIAGTTNELVGFIHLARAEAVGTHSRVVICPTTNGTSCSGNEWRRIMMFVDRDRNGSVSTGDEVRRELDLRNTDVRVSTPVSAARIVFSADGLSSSGLAVNTNNFLSVCSTALPGQTRRIRIGVSASSTGSLSETGGTCQ